MKSIIRIALAAAALTLGVETYAQEAQSVLDLKHSITDSNIIFPDSYELNTQKRLESWYLKNYTASDERYKNQGDVATSDDKIKERLAQMKTVIEMPFNQIVRSYIDRYTAQGRTAVSTLLGLSIYYMPIFEQALEEQGLPLELKYLPIVESGLNPNAVSKHGAAGLWQFMIATGKGLDLEVNSLVDERRDPFKSSRKAAEYLKSLYDTYGDWSLAIAAYNCGPTTVNKAIRRAGGDTNTHDFWSIYYFLPEETRGYVPQFIAANYVMNFYPYHNISPVLATKPLITDTLMIADRVHFEQISHVLDIPIDELRVLNPQFRADVIPGLPQRRYTLVLPSQQIHAYIMSEQAIHDYDRERLLPRIEVEPGEMPSAAMAQAIEQEGVTTDEAPLVPAPQNPQPRQASASGAVKTITHKVQPGESLATIAQKYDVAPEDIKAWNNLTRNSVRTGQQLRITTTAEIAAATGATEVGTAPAAQASTAKTNGKNEGKNGTKANGGKTPAKKEPAAPTSHTVKSGENLSTIAKKYGTTAAELKKANGLTSDNIKPGDKLTLPGKGKAATGKGTSGKGKATTGKKATSKKSTAAKSSSKKKGSKKR